MDYMSKGVKRLFFVIAGVLVLLSLPMFGVNWLGSLVVWFGVSPLVMVFAPVALAVLSFALLVGWVVHRLAFAVFGSKTVLESWRAVSKK